MRNIYSSSIKPKLKEQKDLIKVFKLYFSFYAVYKMVRKQMLSIFQSKKNLEIILMN